MLLLTIVFLFELHSRSSYLQKRCAANSFFGPPSSSFGRNYNETFTYDVCNKQTVGPDGPGTLYMCGDTKYYVMRYTYSTNVMENNDAQGFEVANGLLTPYCTSCPGKL